MNKSFSIILSASSMIFLSCFSMSCLNTRKETSQISNEIPVTKLTGNEISKLENNRVVKFPATLVKSIGNNCVELFTEEDYKKYQGDSKWAIPSKLKSEPSFAELLPGSKSVTVTGRMTFVKDSADTKKTCGIVTGKIFEIIETEELKND